MYRNPSPQPSNLSTFHSSASPSKKRELFLSNQQHSPTKLKYSIANNATNSITNNISSTNQLYSPLQKSRSVFELIEAGESKDIIDNVQFYMDGMLSKFATCKLRRQYAQKLFHLFDSQTQILSVIRGHSDSGNNNNNTQKLLKAFGKILYDQDSITNVFICLTILRLCTRENGMFDETIIIPVECLIGLLQNIVFTKTNKPNSSSFSSSSSVLFPNQDSENSFAKKRKRGVVVTSTSSSTSSVIHKLKNQQDHQNDLISIPMDDSILTLLSSPKYSILFNSIIGNKHSNRTTINECQIAQGLALVIISRCFVTKAQNFSTLTESSQILNQSSFDSTTLSSLSVLLCSSLVDYQEAIRFEHDNNHTWRNKYENHELLFIDSIINQTADLLMLFDQEYCQTISTPTHSIKSGRLKDNSISNVSWKLFQYLNILEAASFKHPLNQASIYSKVTGNSPSSLSFIALISKTFMNITKHEISKLINTSSISNSSSSFITSDINPSTFRREIYSLSMLFSELYHNKSMEIDNSRDSMEASTSSKKNLVENMDYFVIAPDDVYLCCLRIIVNLTHDNTIACSNLLASDSKFLSQYCKLFHTCRSKQYPSNDNSNNDSNNYHHPYSGYSKSNIALSSTRMESKQKLTMLLSPYESSCDRILFDMELYLLTLFANIVESLPSIIIKLVNIEVNQKSLSISPGKSNYSFLIYLIKELLKESESFMKDIEAIDDTNNNDNNNNNNTSKISSPTTKEKDEILPLAEIILSAHISMLLIAIIMNTEQQYMKQEMIEFISSRLPKGSFWLPIRILKAFIVLQGKTGVLLRDNIDPILSSLAFMESINQDVNHIIILSHHSQSSSNKSIKRSLPPSSSSSTSSSPSSSSTLSSSKVNDNNDDWLYEKDVAAIKKLKYSSKSSPSSSSSAVTATTTVHASPQILRKNKISLWGSSLPSIQQRLLNTEMIYDIADGTSSTNDASSQSTAISVSDERIGIIANEKINLTPTSVATDTSQNIQKMKSTESKNSSKCKRNKSVDSLLEIKGDYQPISLHISVSSSWKLRRKFKSTL